jgi:nitrate/TMAO reductase-like tetraheme cytochrome c subunit
LVEKQVIVVALLAVLFAASGAAWSPEECRDCHSAEYRMWEETDHSDLINKLGKQVPDIESCEDCHSTSGLQQKWDR